MPSDTVIVLNSTLFAPAASAPAPASRASTSMCMLHGVTMLHVDAIPTWGLAKSASLKPTARSIARAGAFVSPSTTTLECRRGSAPLPSLRSLLAMGSSGGTFLKGSDYGGQARGGQPRRKGAIALVIRGFAEPCPGE